MDKSNGYRPSFKIHEEVQCSKEELDAVKEIINLHSDTLKQMFRTQIVYGTCGYKLKEDGTTESLTINEIENLKTKI